MTKGIARASAWAKRNRKEILIGAGCAVALVALTAALCALGCSSHLGDTGENVCSPGKSAVAATGQDGTANNDGKEKSNPEQAAGQSTSLEISENGSDANPSTEAELSGNPGNSFANQTNGQSGSVQQEAGGTGAAESGESASTSGNSDSSGSDPTPQKRWITDYESVWVEDAAAWTEQVPIYGYEEHSICNVCGADITGCEASHGKQHMLAGEGSGHHSESVQTITGYTTTEHAAQGHWETVESGGHWE